MPLQGQGQVLAYVCVAHELGSVSGQTWSVVPQSVSCVMSVPGSKALEVGRGTHMLWVIWCPECICMVRCFVVEMIPHCWKEDDWVTRCSWDATLPSCECRDLCSSVSIISPVFNSPRCLGKRVKSLSFIPVIVLT